MTGSVRLMLQRAWSSLPPLVMIGAVLLAWHVYTSVSGIKALTLPSPERVVQQIWLNRADIVDNTIPTLGATLLGFGCSLVAAFLLSVLVDFSALLRRALFPALIISQTLPLIAIAPLVVLWFGFGLLPKILLVALVTFFPLMVALVQGYAAADPEVSRLLASMGASRWQIFRLLRLPTALPFFFAGLRIAITYAVVGAIFAEYAGAEKGLGIYMLAAKNNFRTDLVLAAVAVSAGLTLILFATTLLAEYLAMPWNRVGGPASR